MKTWTLALGLLLALAGGLPQAAASAGLPGDSAYRLTDTYTDQSGRDFTLADGRGKVRLVAMFYTSCRYVCPLIIDSAKGIEHALTPEERARLHVLLVSLDPARDDPAALKQVFDKRRLPADRWTLARTEAAGVRRLAAVLGIRYRPLADGEFNHTSALVLLDGEGRILARTETLGSVPDPDFLAAVKAALAAPAS
ncbi:MAG: SCO family protein [Arenimonas sp.]|nr:SCO family protein [Arenimonas sp.]